MLSSVHTVQPIFLTVSFLTSSFLSISLHDLLFMLGSYTVWRPPRVYAACVYLRPLPATVKPIAPYKALWATPQPTLALCWVSQGSGHWRSRLTEQVAWLQVRPQQRRLMQPIFNAPWCVFSTSAFSAFFYYFQLKCSLRCEERSCILRRNGVFYFEVCVCV